MEVDGVLVAKWVTDAPYSFVADAQEAVDGVGASGRISTTDALEILQIVSSVRSDLESAAHELGDVEDLLERDR